MMLVIPAIDILGGQCVRLYQGCYDSETIYFEDPVKMARLWRVQNARVLHLVDLDAARGGSPNRPHNRDIIAAVADVLDIPLQVGGGIRTLDDVEAMLQLGVYRVVIGTSAVKDPDIISDGIREFGASRLVVGIDARDGDVKTEGWLEGSGLKVVDLALDMEARGCRRIVYTDIGRDGTMKGPNVEAYRNLGEKLTHMRITASGGVSGYKDLLRLSELKTVGVDSVIAGKSLYENAFPCQQFWCWHDKDTVNLNKFSTAELQSRPTGTEAG